jgi:hypothetical protein
MKRIGHGHSNPAIVQIAAQVKKLDAQKGGWRVVALPGTIGLVETEDCGEMSEHRLSLGCKWARGADLLAACQVGRTIVPIKSLLSVIYRFIPARAGTTYRPDPKLQSWLQDLWRGLPLPKA